MQRIAGAILFVMLSLSLVASSANGQDQPATPAEQYQALLDQCNKSASSGKVMTDAERLEFVGEAYKRRYEFASKFVDLAEKYPDDDVALDALSQAVWQVNGTPWPVELVGEDTARAKAFELLRRNHIQSERLIPLCLRISYGFCEEYETFLRAVLAKNPHKEVQAAACLSLAGFLNHRLDRVVLCAEQPEAARDFAGLFGERYLAALLQQDHDKALQEIEATFELASAKYGDVTLPGGNTVAERAQSELFEIRNLSVGKEAPDIEGTDQNGVRFKLSDYRGKVVMLDFWSYV